MCVTAIMCVFPTLKGDLQELTPKVWIVAKCFSGLSPS